MQAAEHRIKPSLSQCSGDDEGVTKQIKSGARASVHFCLLKS